MFRYLVLTFAIHFLIVSNVYPCSSFQLKTDSNSYHSKSYDWEFGDGMIIYNPSQLQKFSLTFNQNTKKLDWVSKYSSLTFNQYGLDFPNGGMNEKGLSVEVLWLDTSVYTAPDDKATLNELQWIQYALDTQSTTEGVIHTLDTIRIEPVYAKVHYLVCDKEKNCATIEFVTGKAVIGKYDKVGFEAITNSTHENSTKYLSLFKNFGGDRGVVWKTYSSLDRYVRVNELLRIYNQKGIVDPVNYAFATLDSVKREFVSTGSYTQWQIVYDKNTLKSYFKTTFGNKEKGMVDLNSFSKECSNRYYYNLNNENRGDVNKKFEPLTFEANYNFVKTTLRKVLPSATEEMIKAISGAPFQFKCLN